MAQHNDLGQWGEKVAREYLITRGYTIVEQDTRKGFYELDIIAIKGNRIIFAEVKTRSAGSFDPLEAITPQKISRICSAANSFIVQYQYPHEVQFDIIAVIGNPQAGHKIEHIPDAFVPPLRGYR